MASAPLPSPLTRSPFPFPSHLHTSTLLLPRRRLPPPFSFPFPRFPLPTPHPPPTDNHRLPIGDCLVFDEDAFDSPDDPSPPHDDAPTRPESLVPENWRQAVAEINIDKKERRRLAHQLKFGSRIERRGRGSDRPPAVLKSEEYLAFREKKLQQLRPVVLDDPVEFAEAPRREERFEADRRGFSAERAAPRNPREGLEGGSLESISDYFSSGDYVPGGGDDDDKKPRGAKRLFSQEEKVLLNKKVPDLSTATSRKWLPLHTFAASGEFYLMDGLLKYDVDINAVDADGLSAIHRAILGKKQAILNYLLRESANPFVRDNDGASLMHYAVQTASSLAIKTLLLYNVDINQPDFDGWTPLHLAVQTQRIDMVKLLLIKGADTTLKNKDGLTPLDMCLYSGRSERTYEIIKLLTELPKTRRILFYTRNEYFWRDALYFNYCARSMLICDISARDFKWNY